VWSGLGVWLDFRVWLGSGVSGCGLVSGFDFGVWLVSGVSECGLVSGFGFGVWLGLGVWFDVGVTSVFKSRINVSD
jgi:hypothetical protein